MACTEGEGEPVPFKAFVGGLSHHTTDDTLRAYFEQYGTVTEACVMREKVSRRSRGFGFVTYQSAQSLEIMLLSTRHILGGSNVEVKRAVPFGVARYSKVFVGGLASTTTKFALREYFEHFGTVSSTIVLKDRIGQSRGFGFVTYESDESVLEALSETEHRVQGRLVEVKRADPHTSAKRRRFDTVSSDQQAHSDGPMDYFPAATTSADTPPGLLVHPMRAPFDASPTKHAYDANGDVNASDLWAAFRPIPMPRYGPSTVPTFQPSASYLSLQWMPPTTVTAGDAVPASSETPPHWMVGHQ